MGASSWSYYFSCCERDNLDLSTDLQWIALGLILIINIVYFQQGLMGWLQTKYPEMFGIVVDDGSKADKAEA